MDSSLRIVYFAWLRDKIGRSGDELPLPDWVATVSDVVDYVSRQGAGHAEAFRNRKAIRCAVNQAFADLSAPVRAGDEVAFFPPVTGG